MIQTESTPNPDSIKFLSEKTLSTIGSEEFKKDQRNEIIYTICPPYPKNLIKAHFL